MLFKRAFQSKIGGVHEQIEALFDPAWYYIEAGRLPLGIDLLTHYMESGGFSGLNPNPIFQSAWYLRTYEDVFAAKINPLMHYVSYGAKELRDPSPHFSTAAYIKSNPDIPPGFNPLLHYFRFSYNRRMYSRGDKARGRPSILLSQGQDKKELFSSSWYLAKYSKFLQGHKDDIYEHYKSFSSQGFEPNPLFNSSWYAEQYGCQMTLGTDPLSDYAKDGASSGRNPSPFFDTLWYKTQIDELLHTNENPLAHYLRVGRFENRPPSPLFHLPFGQINSEEDHTALLEIPKDFEASDFIGYIPNYTTLENLRFHRDYRSFTTPDQPRWIITPLESPTQARNFCFYENVMIIGGIPIIFHGNQAIDSLMRFTGATVGSRTAIVTPVIHSVGPIFPNAIYLLTDLRQKEVFRELDAIRRIANLPGAWLNEALVLVDDDLSNKFYADLALKLPKKQKVVRLRRLNVYCVGKLIIPPEETGDVL